MSIVRSITAIFAWLKWIGLCLLVGNPVGAATLTPVPNTKVVHEYDPNNHIPAFSGNAFLRLRGNQSPSPAIEALDLQGNLRSVTSIAVPDARVTTLYGFSRANDGTVAASGWSESYDGKTAFFVAVVPRADQAPTIIRTNSYAAHELAIAADGTVWTVGNVLNRKADLPDADPKGGTVRHYDRSGKLLDSYFPYSALNDQVRVMMGFLSASRGRIGWISTGDPHGGNDRLGAYVEFSAGGKVDEYALPPIAPQSGAVLFGLALTDDGSTLATVLVARDKEQMFSLNRSTRAWEPVSPPGLPAGASFLSGASGNTVAVWEMPGKEVHFYAVEK